MATSRGRADALARFGARFNLGPGGADKGRMRLGRLYVAALCLALVGLVAYTAVPKHATGHPRPASGPQMRAMESAALERLHFPASFVRLSRGCPVGRCYLVRTPATRIVAIMPGLLRSAGLQRAGALRAAEPVAALRQTHWSTAFPDPLVIACKTVYTSARQPLGMCQDAGRFGATLVNVLVTPYAPCHQRSCVKPGMTEVIAWSVAFPTGA